MYTLSGPRPYGPPLPFLTPASILTDTGHTSLCVSVSVRVPVSPPPPTASSFPPVSPAFVPDGFQNGSHANLGEIYFQGSFGLPFSRSEDC